MANEKAEKKAAREAMRHLMPEYDGWREHERKLDKCDQNYNQWMYDQIHDRVTHRHKGFGTGRKGCGGSYRWNEELHEWVKVSDKPQITKVKVGLINRRVKD